MLKSLQVILQIQELDMKMIRLIRLKSDREKELDQIASIRGDLQAQVSAKEAEIKELQLFIRTGESEVEELKERLKSLEEQQSSVKKLEEFNALTQQMSQVERERVTKEQTLSDTYDKVTDESDLLTKLQESLNSTTETSRVLQQEIIESIEKINAEGSSLKEERNSLVEKAEPEIFAVYERLLRNKKDRVVVPIENRACSGCHIVLTAQHENVVRKGEKLVVCDFCSRIHYWQDSQDFEVTELSSKRRRRKKASV